MVVRWSSQPKRQVKTGGFVSLSLAGSENHLCLSKLLSKRALMFLNVASGPTLGLGEDRPRARQILDDMA
jgi:hypothetical protein